MYAMHTQEAKPAQGAGLGLVVAALAVSCRGVSGLAGTRVTCDDEHGHGIFSTCTILEEGVRSVHVQRSFGCTGIATVAFVRGKRGMLFQHDLAYWSL